MGTVHDILTGYELPPLPEPLPETPWIDRRRTATKQRHRKANRLNEPLHRLRLFAGLGTDEAAELCGVSKYNWRRWERGNSNAPLSVIRLLECYAGHVPGGSGRWEGFEFRGDEMITANGEVYTAGEIEGIRWLQNRVDLLMHRNHQLRIRLRCMARDSGRQVSSTKAQIEIVLEMLSRLAIENLQQEDPILKVFGHRVEDFLVHSVELYEAIQDYEKGE